MKLYQVTTKAYCAGLVVNELGAVVKAAPILKWTYGNSIESLKVYFKSKIRLINSFKY